LCSSCSEVRRFAAASARLASVVAVDFSVGSGLRSGCWLVGLKPAGAAAGSVLAGLVGCSAGERPARSL